MHKKYYVLLESSHSITVSADLDQRQWNLERQIPAASRIRMLQFNWATTGTLGMSLTDHGMVLRLEEIAAPKDFMSSVDSSVETCSILAQIPLETFFLPSTSTILKKEGTYEPHVPCEVEINAPITSITITSRSSFGGYFVGSKLSGFNYTVLLEVEEECNCKT